MLNDLLQFLSLKEIETILTFLFHSNNGQGWLAHRPSPKFPNQNQNPNSCHCFAVLPFSEGADEVVVFNL